jgi:hypothetical protein
MGMTPVSGTRIFTTAMNFASKNFMGLLGTAAIPILLVLIFSTGMNWVDVQNMADAVRQPDAPEKLPPPHYFVLVLLVVFTQIWMLVRTYRFRLKSEFPVTSSELGGTLWVFAYALALALIIVAPILLLAGVAAGAVLLGNTDIQPVISNGWFIAAAIIAGLAAIVALCFWAVRISVAFPGIAIGRRPAIFGDMWTMGRGVTWALLGWSILLGFAVGTILGIMMIAGMVVVFSTLLATPDSAQLAAIVEQNIWWIMAAAAVMQLPSLLYNIASSVIFAEAYAQLNRPPAA